MARRVELKICPDKFRRLWAAGCSRDELTHEFLCSVSTVDAMRSKLGLPRRKISRFLTRQATPDPTPQEILERAAECRQLRSDQKRRETYATTLQWRKGAE
jgi:hypothetical protein